MSNLSVPFLDLRRIHEEDLPEFLGSLKQQVLNNEFVLGTAVADFERSFSEYVGQPNAISTNSGTSAIHLALLALGVGPGDEVIVPGLTFIATAAAVAYTGATPVFADVDDKTWTVDPNSVQSKITPRTKAIIVVHLHGLMANMPEICKIAQFFGLFVVEDAAQAHGAAIGQDRVGSFGDASCFSFYPGKNLGALGEGGAVFVRSVERADRARMLRNWASKDKYRHEEIGFNYRMESIQAAFLSIKLRKLELWTQERQRLSRKYELALGSFFRMCQYPQSYKHVRHIFAIRVSKREELINLLDNNSIGWGIHYPIPLHLQPAFSQLGYKRGSLPVSENLASELLSLPLFPGMTDEEIHRVISIISTYALK